jgi:hypothetical protein
MARSRASREGLATPKNRRSASDAPGSNGNAAERVKYPKTAAGLVGARCHLSAACGARRLAIFAIVARLPANGLKWARPVEPNRNGNRCQHRGDSSRPQPHRHCVQVLSRCRREIYQIARKGRERLKAERLIDLINLAAVSSSPSDPASRESARRG